MANQPSSLTARFAQLCRLLVDFVMVIGLGILWVPLHLAQPHVSAEPAEIEVSAESRREASKRKLTGF